MNANCPARRGDLDLLVGCIGGGVRLFLNDGTGRFTESADSGLARRYCVTTLALADVDGDGDLDVAANNLEALVAVCRNNAFAARVAVHLRGRGPWTSGISARVTLRGRVPEQSQEVLVGGRYLAGAEPRRVSATRGGEPFEL